MKKILILLMVVLLHAESLDELDKKCKKNKDFDSCAKYYEKVYNGANVKSGYLYLNLCSKSNPKACSKAAGTLLESIKPISKNTILEIAKIYELGCSYNDAESCHKIGVYTGFDNIDNYLVNYYASLERLQKACDLGYKNHSKTSSFKDPCDDLIKVQQNLLYSQALGFYKKPKEEYLKVYNIFKKEKPFSKVNLDINDLEDSCDYDLHFKTGKTIACFLTGYLLLIEQDYEMAEKYLKIPCDNNDLEACANLVLVNKLQNKNDEKLNKKFINDSKKACANDDYDGCTALAIAYKNGLGVKQDIKKAKNILEKSCLYANGISCYELGNIYLHEQNQAKAKKLYIKACHLGDIRACDVYNDILSGSKNK